MRRRDFLAMGTGGALTLLSTSTQLRGISIKPPPNILWVTCEDMSPNLGCYGDAYAITPNLDRFAGEGVRFTQAVGITGVCAVNRSCLITGMYSSSLGSHDMRSRIALPDNIKCFSDSLRRAGYYCTNNAKTDYNFPVPKDAWDDCGHKAHWKNRKPGQPFFAVFNFTGTHESRYRVSPKNFAALTKRLKPGERHDPAKAPVPPFHPDTPTVRRDWANYYDTITAMDYWFGDKLRELSDAGLADNTIVFFYSDHGVGLPGCKKWVWNGGLQVPLLIRTPKPLKHLALAPAGSVTDRQVSFVDFAPTVMSLARQPIPRHMQGKAFLGGQAAAPRTFNVAIRDRMAERYDTVRVVRDDTFQYHRNFMPHLPWAQFVSYTEQMPTMKVWRQLHQAGKLNKVQDRYFQPKPLEELYHIADDPHMIRNLADDPKYKTVLSTMRKRLRQWQLETRDLGLLPEYEMHSRAKSRGVTFNELARDPKAYPMEKILDAADLASRRQPGNLLKLKALLSDREPAVRWWAAVGLTALGKKTKPARQALEKALKDASPIVRIAAADALCNVGGTDAALPVLKAGLQHETPFVRLRAINVIDRIGEAARPLMQAVKKATMEKGAVFPADYFNRMTQYVPRKWAE